MTSIPLKLGASLRHHEPVSRREREVRALMLAALAVLPDPFSLDRGGLHFTGSAIVLSPSGVLLHHHRKLSRWLQPGGHVEAGEAPWDTAFREIGEETGIRPSNRQHRLVHVDAHDAGVGHTHLDLRYLFLSEATLPLPRNDESPNVRWFSLDEVAALGTLEPALLEAIRSSLALLQSDPIGSMKGELARQVRLQPSELPKGKLGS